MNKRRLTIYISGLYSGPNPSPGIGIARSLRTAYPDAILIGVDYSVRSLGLHWIDFDDLWLQRPWDELDLTEYALQIKEKLEMGAFWISGLDLEIFWLSNALPRHPRLLIPSSKSLTQVMKPNISACKDLPMKIPPYMPAFFSENELHKFCRKHGWPIWVKGPWYEARLVGSWHEAKMVYLQLSESWSTNLVFFQADVSGYEESIALCALNGELLDCVYMSKRDVTPEGKTWAGHISEVPTNLLEPLREVIKRLNWTGGAELECVRDDEGILWLLEWNPRFPAWIYGATIAGHNLPALLLKRAANAPILYKPETLSTEFVRVVLEVPARPNYPLPPLPASTAEQKPPFFKHPSGLPILARRLRDKLPLMARGKVVQAISDYDKCSGENKLISGDLQNILRDLAMVDFRKIDTPCWLFFESTARYLFQEASKITQLSSNFKFRIAYSVKTNPDSRLLCLAREFGFLAETISQAEIARCISEGFNGDQIILNGPGKWWPSGTLRPFPIYALFCDSIEELENVIELLKSGVNIAHIVGVRLRPPQINSRFGVPVSSPDVFQRLIRLVTSLPSGYAFGVHFHIPSSEIGIKCWWRVFNSMIRWGKSVEISSGKELQYLDIGGGFYPGDLQEEIQPRLGNMGKQLSQILPSLREVILEPGKSIVQPAMGLAVRVLEIRHSQQEAVEAVVDGSIAELPEAWHYPHRVLYISPNGEFKILRRGKSRLLGRLCMERDVLATDIEIPSKMREGDVLIFCDVGAYDRSMAYAFGRG